MYGLRCHVGGIENLVTLMALFKKDMEGVELFFPLFMYFMGWESPFTVCLWGEGEGWGYDIVCMACSLIEFMMVYITCCAYVHFLRSEGVASCGSSVSCWMLMKFGSLHLLRKA